MAGKRKRNLRKEAEGPSAEEPVVEPPSPVLPIDDKISERSTSPPPNSQVSVTHQAWHFSSPFLPPEILASYEQVVPGSAERFIALVERQTDHRIAVEKAITDGDNKRANNGVAAAFAIVMTAIVAGTVAACFGQPWAGGVIATTGIATIAGAFIYGTRTRASERKEKAAIMMGQQQATEQPQQIPQQPQ